MPYLLTLSIGANCLLRADLRPIIVRCNSRVLQEIVKYLKSIDVVCI